VLSADAATTGSVAASAPALRAAAPQPEAKRAQDNSKTLTGVTVSAARRGPADQTLAEVVSVGASPAEFLHAAEEGDLPSLRRQLDRHVDIDSRDSLGRTALMLATLRGQAEAVDLLLDNGADPNVADNRGTTPVQVARQAHATAIVSALERKGPLR
jgi:ankyrin repeat protein